MTQTQTQTQTQTTQTQMTQASPIKLRDGSWGAKVTGTVAIGDRVRITTAAGKTWEAVVARVVWSDSGVAICVTAAAGHDTPRATSYAGIAARNARATSTPDRRGGTWTGCDCGSREDAHGDLIPSRRNCRECMQDA